MTFIYPTVGKFAKDKLQKTQIIPDIKTNTEESIK